MDARLSQYINNYLFGKGEARLITVDLERFAELFVYCTRGTVDEKLKVLLISLGKESEVNGDIPYILVKEVSADFANRYEYNDMLTIMSCIHSYNLITIAYKITSGLSNSIHL